jgi:hypothetical protein
MPRNPYDQDDQAAERHCLNMTDFVRSSKDSTLASKDGDKHRLARQAVIFALLGWPAADLAVVVGLLISGKAHASASDWLRMLFQVGLIGTVAGLAMWATVHSVRLAIRR